MIRKSPKLIQTFQPVLQTSGRSHTPNPSGVKIVLPVLGHKLVLPWKIPDEPAIPGIRAPMLEIGGCNGSIAILHLGCCGKTEQTDMNTILAQHDYSVGVEKLASLTWDISTLHRAPCLHHGRDTGTGACCGSQGPSCRMRRWISSCMHACG